MWLRFDRLILAGVVCLLLSTAPGARASSVEWAVGHNPVTVFSTVAGRHEPSPYDLFFQRMIAQIFQDAGIPLRTETESWNRAMERLQVEPDTSLYPTTRTEAREELFHWVGPIGRTQWRLYGLEGGVPGVDSLHDASKLGPIGAAMGSARLDHLLSKDGINVIEAPTNAALFRMLLNGRIGFWATSSTTARFTAQEINTDFNRLQHKLTYRVCYLYLALSKSTDADLVDRLQRAAFRFRTEGGYVTLRKYMLPNRRIDSPVVKALTDPATNHIGCVDKQ